MMPRLENAACAGATPTQALCARCWDRPECLAWALEYERTEYWAGYNAAGRSRLREQFDITPRTFGDRA